MENIYGKYFSTLEVIMENIVGKIKAYNEKLRHIMKKKLKKMEKLLMNI